jgi:hypothetical protein
MEWHSSRPVFDQLRHQYRLFAIVGKKPAIVSATILAAVALTGYLSSGSVETELFAIVLWI